MLRRIMDNNAENDGYVSSPGSAASLEEPVAYVEEEGEQEPGEEQQFDISLPATHSYMGPGLETLGGRRVLEPGWTGRVPGVSHHGVVFPGETVPMLMPETHGDVIMRDRLFVLLCPEVEQDSAAPPFGVLCEVLQGGRESVLARAAHRVRLRSAPPAQPYPYARMRMVDVAVLPELAPDAPLRPARPPSLDALRRPHQDSRLQRQILALDAAGSAWPAFVWRLFDYRRLRARLREHFATLDLADKMPADAVSLSFWVASNLAFSLRDRLAMFAVDNALLRLGLALQCIQRSWALSCRACGAELARREHVFAMSSDGVHANYTNLGGFMHDVVTVREARELALGEPSAEFSWFPGYRWRVAQCAACRTHVGWRFDAMKRRLRPAQFFALCRNTVEARARVEVEPDLL